MVLDPREDLLLRRYLLGDLSPAERIDVDARLFLEPQFSELLEIAEAELLDDFLYGDLTAAERSQFETNYLAERPEYGSNYPILDERRQSLRFATALKQNVESAPDPVPVSQPSSPDSSFFARWFGGNSPWWRIPLTAAVLLLVLVGGWMIIRAVLRARNNPPPQEVKRTPPSKTERSAPPPSETPTPVGPDERVQQDNTSPSPRPPASPPVRDVNHDLATILAASIYVSAAGRVRGDSSPTSFQNLTTKVTYLRLALVDPVEGENFEAELRDENGRPLSRLSKPMLVKTGQVPNILIKVPTSLIPPADYQIGLSEVGLGGKVRLVRTYYFSVQAPNSQTVPPK